MTDQPTQDLIRRLREQDQDTDAASDAGVTGTPTVFVNRKKSELLAPAGLRQIVDEASTGE